MKLVFWHWFWLFFMSLLSSSEGLSSDGLALLALSKSLILPSSLRSNWTASDATPCAWNGVGCNGRNRVISLDLSSSGVSGSIGPEIGHLKYLQNLSLSANNISGSIPRELGNLKKLSLLSLYQNSFEWNNTRRVVQEPVTGESVPTWQSAQWFDTLIGW